jgi:hypothetical protein
MIKVIANGERLRRYAIEQSETAGLLANALRRIHPEHFDAKTTTEWRSSMISFIKSAEMFAEFMADYFVCLDSLQQRLDAVERRVHDGR